MWTISNSVIEVDVQKSTGHIVRCVAERPVCPRVDDPLPPHRLFYKPCRRTVVSPSRPANALKLYDDIPFFWCVCPPHTHTRTPSLPVRAGTRGM